MDDTLLVKELIAQLQEMDPDAQVEFEAHDGMSSVRGAIRCHDPIRIGDRMQVTGLRQTFYNEPSNKWVILT